MAFTAKYRDGSKRALGRWGPSSTRLSLFSSAALLIDIVDYRLFGFRDRAKGEPTIILLVCLSACRLACALLPCLAFFRSPLSTITRFPLSSLIPELVFTYCKGIQVEICFASGEISGHGSTLGRSEHESWWRLDSSNSRKACLGNGHVGLFV